MDCIFCKIIKGEIKEEKIYEDETCIVITDKFPGSKGQSLVISKIHEPYVFNLPDKVYEHMFKIAKKVGKAIDKAFKPYRTCVVVEGFDVPHVHIRLHPSYNKDLVRNGLEASTEERKQLVKEIKKNL